MNSDLDEKLCMKYPVLYRNRRANHGQSLMQFGFACSDDWYSLIDTVSEMLHLHQPATEALQVKEKFGSLCFFYTPCDDYTWGLVSISQQISASTCEICGAPGAMYYANHWVSTRCASHVQPDQQAGRKTGLEVSPVLGLGLGWSRLMRILDESIAWHTEKNGMPETRLKVTVNKSCLAVAFTGGNKVADGMVNFVNSYARRIDNQTVIPIIFE